MGETLIYLQSLRGLSGVILCGRFHETPAFEEWETYAQKYLLESVPKYWVDAEKATIIELEDDDLPTDGLHKGRKASVIEPVFGKNGTLLLSAITFGIPPLTPGDHTLIWLGSSGKILIR